MNSTLCLILSFWKTDEPLYPYAQSFPETNGCRRVSNRCEGDKGSDFQVVPGHPTHSNEFKPAKC